MIGTRLGHFEITAHLGSGGMGDVYQATDLKLNRTVAIKVLPEGLVADADRLARFRREAQVLASLNHPNIAHIHGLEESAEAPFIVMELIVGETLQGRIKRGQIPIDESLAIAKQIAEAMEAAHEAGVIHRDLKPGNVMLSAEGSVKVLDFGLAKAGTADGSDTRLSNSPTMMSLPATHAGVILGTAAYMSPEQATGGKVDQRADIFAFGGLLFEMLTNKPAFEGESTLEVLGSVLKSEPDWTLLPKQTPPVVRNLLRLCLEKNVKNRRGSATDVRLDLEQGLKELPDWIHSEAPAKRGSRLPWIVAAAVAVAFVSSLVVQFGKPPALSLPRVRASLNLTDGIFSQNGPVISPDGTRVVFTGKDITGSVGLWIRSLNSADTRRLVSAAATDPFWSPDSRWIAFFADGKLEKVDAERGTVQILADAPTPRGGAWNQNDVILFIPRFSEAMVRIPATGGLPMILKQTASLDPADAEFLPDGDHFLFTSISLKMPERGLYIGSLASERLEKISSIPSMARYSPPGYLLFVEQNALMAKRFNLTTMSTSGTSLQIEDRVSNFSVSHNGLLAFLEESNELRQLTWFDRAGQLAGTIGRPDAIHNFRLSPDQKRVALDRSEPLTGKRDIWLIDNFSNAIPNRFTADPSDASGPAWSPDGKTIVFLSRRDGQRKPYRKDSSGNDMEEPLRGGTISGAVWDWSPDGAYLLVWFQDGKTGFDIQLVPMDGAVQPTWFLKTPFNEGQARISPDGKYVLYTSDESGRREIYIQTFPKPGNKRRISNEGGFWPRWRGDGKELFYIAANLTVTSVSLDHSNPLNGGPSQPLFQFPTGPDMGGIGSVEPFEVSTDGRRFLVLPEKLISSISLIVNWQSQLK